MRHLSLAPWILAMALGGVSGLAGDAVVPSDEYELIPIPESAIHHGAARAPRIRHSAGTSTNWSGYAVPAGTTTDVKGTWVVPHTAASTSATTYSSTWVGIDGYDTNTVEQIGTEDDRTPSGERHYAWFEMYPQRAYLINGFPVVAGDVITAEVKVTGKSNFTLTIQNVTQNKSFSTTRKAASARKGSAEWVVEAPWSGGVLPLANFGAVTLSACSATIDGATHGLGFPDWAPDSITMVTGGASSVDKAIPSALAGDGFTVTWSHE